MAPCHNHLRHTTAFTRLSFFFFFFFFRLISTPPVPTSPVPDTCSALRSIATSGQYCSATALCDGVDCQYLNYRIRMRLLPCSNPPSIALTAYDQTTGTVYYNQTLSQSQRTTLVNGFLSLDVTLLQRSNAIGLQVMLWTNCVIRNLLGDFVQLILPIITVFTELVFVFVCVCVCVCLFVCLFFQYMGVADSHLGPKGCVLDISCTSSSA